jgi:hypothetical protein
MTPSVAHIIVTSHPAPTPSSRSPAPGQLMGWFSRVAMTGLATAPAAKQDSVITRAETATATSFATYTVTRETPWPSNVFQVPQAYSPPTTSTPRISASAPRKTGLPPMELPTSWSGRVAASPRSLFGGPCVPPA